MTEPDAWLVDLASDIPVLQERAETWFHDQGPDAADALIRGLSDRRLGSAGRWRILLLLRAIAPRQALPAVLAVLHEDDPVIRPGAMEVLAAIATPQAVDALSGLLHHGNPDVRKYAAYLLGKTADPRATDRLCALLDDGDPSIRYSAIQGLITLHDPAARAAIARHRPWETDSDNQRLIDTSNLAP